MCCHWLKWITAHVTILTNIICDWDKQDREMDFLLPRCTSKAKRRMQHIISSGWLDFVVRQKTNSVGRSHPLYKERGLWLVYKHSNRHTPSQKGVQDAFKDSMTHWILQFALRIAFRCVLHRCGSQDIRCWKCWSIFLFGRKYATWGNITRLAAETFLSETTSPLTFSHVGFTSVCWQSASVKKHRKLCKKASLRHRLQVGGWPNEKTVCLLRLHSCSSL